MDSEATMTSLRFNKYRKDLKHLYSHRSKIKNDIHKLKSEEKRVKEILEKNHKLSGSKRAREENENDSKYFDQEKPSKSKPDSHSHKRSKHSEHDDKEPKA